MHLKKTGYNIHWGRKLLAIAKIQYNGYQIIPKLSAPYSTATLSCISKLLPIQLSPRRDITNKIIQNDKPPSSIAIRCFDFPKI